MLSGSEVAGAGGSQPMTFFSGGSLKNPLDALGMLSGIQLFPAEYENGT